MLDCIGRNTCNAETCFLSQYSPEPMIDLEHIQYFYSKEEVSAYLTENAMSVEDLLQLLIEKVQSCLVHSYG